nr:nero [Cucujiformia]
YCLGQMQDERSIEALISVLESIEQEPIVRHEAAEALGAIGTDNVISYLLKYKNDSVSEVAETCELALDRINWYKTVSNDEKNKLSINPYKSVDPAPPSLVTDINKLKLMIIDENLSLFEKYRAMFALRNIASKETINILGEALDHGSALFKHEIAFVLGQLQNDTAVPYLKKKLEDIKENEMVSHECA